ncbi:hypothetical protein BGZ70_008054, partial [Mortierella alpina]
CEKRFGRLYSTNFWKHKWDAQLSREEEFFKVAEGLLNMVGGFVGQPSQPHQHIVIAVGLAKFTASHGPPSLDSKFESYFVNLLHPATESSYVMIMEPQKVYTLPRTKNDLQELFKGLVKLLRIRTALKATIEEYSDLRHAPNRSDTMSQD